MNPGEPGRPRRQPPAAGRDAPRPTPSPRSPRPRCADALWRLCLAIVGYTYLGYPLLLALLAWSPLARRTDRLSASFGAQALVDAGQASGAGVAIVIPAYNEAAVIEAKLRNTLDLVAAEARGARVVVVSDGSSDGTDALAQRWEARGVRLVRLPHRSGKGAALAAGVAASEGELLVLTDANAELAAGSLCALLDRFADPRVGVVGGAKRIRSALLAGPSRQEGWYWRYEDLLKRLEDRLGHVAGADGALMALRRAAWEDLPDDRAGQDFFPALRAVARGWRLAYEPTAVAWEHAAPSVQQELGRKDRTLGSGLVALWRLPRLLGPRHPQMAWVLISHRLLRFAVLPALAGALLGSVLGSSRAARPLFWLQVGCYLAALGGWAGTRLGVQLPTVLLAPYYFLALHVGTVRAVAWALRPRTQDLWTPIPRLELTSHGSEAPPGADGSSPAAGPADLDRPGGLDSLADRVGAAILLAASLPAWLPLALLVRLGGTGPIFHRREVLGRGGRRFHAFKFRTMVPDADTRLAADPLLRARFQERYKLDDDPRVTRTGRWLRRSGLDELPQLLNVLRGEMSLVGPRMISPDELPRYGEHGALLLSVRPGLTGLWQVSGRSRLSYADRVRLDLEYLRRRSRRLDLAILARTPLAMVRG